MIEDTGWSSAEASSTFGGHCFILVEPSDVFSTGGFLRSTCIASNVWATGSNVSTSGNPLRSLMYESWPWRH